MRQHGRNPPGWPPLPDEGRASDGHVRAVGVELEFGGLEPRRTAGIVADMLGGSPVEISEYEYRVDGSRLGDFRIEVDLRVLTRLGRELANDGEEGNELKRLSADVLGAFASAVTPVEIITPPIAAPSLPELDRVVPPLREAGALGTSHSPFYAFGLQFNPDVPDTEPGTLVAYLQAFLCLYDWLKRKGDIDPVRRLTPFINRFPGEYEERVLSDDYAPDFPAFLRDYLAWNPTRNRALDLLPLLAWLDEETVRARLPSEKINRRPTFHYRLPDCEIHQPEWSIASPWRDWLQVEYLARDPERLAEIRRARRRDRRRLTSALDDDWIYHSEGWLIDLSSV